MSELKKYLTLIAQGAPLDETSTMQAVEIMFRGEADHDEIADFLSALSLRGETVEEITGAVRAMRAHMNKVVAPSDAIDTCGTGGDGADTYNISTAAAFVLAGAGLKVAKHGNRAATSRSGSSQVLEALGVNIQLEPNDVARCIRECNIGFMMAPLHHGAMKHVAPVRQALGKRTLFNLIGPLSNPAGVKHQIIGVFDKRLLEPFARVLRQLGSVSAWVVHGSDGLDELTTTGVSHVCALEKNDIRLFDITPEEVGLKRAVVAALKGGDPDFNAQALLGVLKGEEGAYRDIVLLNAAAGLVVGGKVSSLKGGITCAAQSIDKGQALSRLHQLIEVSNAKASARA